MGREELIKYLKNNLQMRARTSGNWLTVELYLEGELITRTESVQIG